MTRWDMDYQQFKAWKVRCHARQIGYCREYRAKGDHRNADRCLQQAASIRQSIYR